MNEVGTALRAVLAASDKGGLGIGDWGWQRGAKVQIGAELLCEGAKVEARVQSTDYGVRSAG